MELKARKKKKYIPKMEVGASAYPSFEQWQSGGLQSQIAGLTPGGIGFKPKLGILIPPKGDLGLSAPITLAAKNKIDIGSLGNAISPAIDFTQSIFQAFGNNKSVGEIEVDAGNRSVSGGGFSWQRQNDVNNRAEIDQLNKENTANTFKTTASGAALGASVGSIFPGAGTLVGGAVGAIGGLVGGLFGGKSRRKKLNRRMFNAQQDINRLNNYSMSSAQSNYLDTQYGQNHENTQDDYLYANKGKDSNMRLVRYNKGKDSVVTPYGIQKGTINSIIGQGEPTWNPTTGFAYTPYLKGGKSGNNENIPSGIKPNDENVVFSTKYGYADLARPYAQRIENNNQLFLKQQKLASKFQDKLGYLGQKTSQLQKQMMDSANKKDNEVLSNIAEMQRNDPRRQGISHMAKGSNSNTATIPFWQRAAVNAIPMIGNAAQALWWANQSVHKPDIYAANPYESQALSTLAGLRINPYAQIQAVSDADRMQQYAINNSGGMTGGQRYLARIANNIGAQKNYANILATTNEANNKYAAAYADAALNAGNAQAARRQQANQFAEEAYDKGRGAKINGMWNAIAGAGQAAQQWYANEFKYKTYQDTADLYRQQLSDEQKRALSELESKRPYTATPQYKYWGQYDKRTPVVDMRYNIPQINTIRDLLSYNYLNK